MAWTRSRARAGRWTRPRPWQIRPTSPAAKARKHEGRESVKGYRSVGIVGGGAWGAALAQVCVRAGLKARLWAREAEVVQAINATHENPLFLPGVRLADEVVAVTDLAELAGVDLILAV